MALFYVRCLSLRSTFAATAPASAVSELGVVRRLATSPVKKPYRGLLLLLLIIVAVAGWVFNRVQNGIVIATAHSPNYSCRVTELPDDRSSLAQFLRIGTGTKVYLCEVRSRSGRE